MCYLYGNGLRYSEIVDLCTSGHGEIVWCIEQIWEDERIVVNTTMHQWIGDMSFEGQVE